MTLLRSMWILLAACALWSNAHGAQGAAAESAAATARDWPAWRGPRGDGVSLETGWHVQGVAAPLWRAEVGLGYSSVSVAGERLVTAGHDVEAGEDVIRCLDAEGGRVLWARRFPSARWNDQHEGGTNSTPVIDGERVFAVNREGRAQALELATGEVIWERDLAGELELTLPSWGFAASPVVRDGRVYLNLDRLLALDADSGKLLWQTEAFGDTYSTPTAIELDGRACLAAVVSRALVAVDRASGEVLGSYPWTNSLNAHAASPVDCGGGRVFVSSGYERGGALVELGEGGAREVWTNRLMRNKMATSVLFEGHLYGFDESVLKCLDLEGRERWRERGLGRGALMVADGKLLFLTARGELVMAQATPEAYRELSRRAVLGAEGSVYWTAPALVGGRIYCRDNRGTLVCLDHREAGEDAGDDAAVTAASGADAEGEKASVLAELRASIEGVPPDELDEWWRVGDPLPDPETLLRVATRDGGQVAVALLRAVRAVEPGFQPGEFRSWRDLAWRELSQGRPRSAWYACRVLVEAWPERADGYRRLGDACTALHELSAALEHYRRGLELDPSSAYLRARIDELAE